MINKILIVVEKYHIFKMTRDIDSNESSYWEIKHSKNILYIENQFTTRHGNHLFYRACASFLLRQEVSQEVSIRTGFHISKENNDYGRFSPFYIE